ncbi:MAG: hypothetical protein ACK4MV_16390 [Beijerinckiaceae bacterium]
MTEPGGDNIIEADQKPPRTIEEMRAFADGICQRCTPRPGYVSRETLLILGPHDHAGFDAIVRFFDLILPHRDELVALVNGRARRNFGRRA